MKTTIQVDFQRMNFEYSQKIKHHFIISNALIIANGLIWLTALFVTFSCQRNHPIHLLKTKETTRQLLRIQKPFATSNQFINIKKKSI
jgi:hypothetical protein